MIPGSALWVVFFGIIAVLLFIPSNKMPKTKAEKPIPHWLEAKSGALPERHRKVVSWFVGLTIFILFWEHGALGILGLAGGIFTYLFLGRLETSSAKVARLEKLRQLPTTLDLLAAVLEAGTPMREALRLVVEFSSSVISADLAKVQAQIQVGISDVESWRTLSGDEIWGDVAADIARSAQFGTPVAQILRIHSETLRQEAREQGLAEAKAVGVKSALPLICCFLPAFILVGVIPILASAFTQVVR